MSSQKLAGNDLKVFLVTITMFLTLLAHGQVDPVDDQKEKAKEQIELAAKAHVDEEPEDSTLHPAVQQGFVPVPIITTEPALGGIGGGLAIGYLHSNRKSLRDNTPPTITGVLGGGTRNKTWYVGAGHSHSFKNDHIRYAGGAIKSNVNIAFYDQLPVLGDIAFDVKMDAWGVLQKLLFRIKESNLFIGPTYTFFQTTNRLDEDTDHPLLDSLINSVEVRSRLGAMALQVIFDSRDNALSVNEGIYAGGELSYNAGIFGGDDQFLRMELYSKFFVPVGAQVFSAFRVSGEFTGDEIPFYAKPYVKLRGAPAARYQGTSVLTAETQWRWNFYKSLSVLGFVGTGKALNDFGEFSDQPWIYSYGGGARFALPRLFDLRMGVDVAWSNEDFAWYIAVGETF